MPVVSARLDLSQCGVHSERYLEKSASNLENRQGFAWKGRLLVVFALLVETTINWPTGHYMVSVCSSPLACSRTWIDYGSWLTLLEWCLGIVLAGGMQYLRSGAWWS